MKNTLFIASFLCVANLSSASAQEAFTGSGGDGNGPGGSNSYTVGLVSYTTKSDGVYTVADGIQQAYEISQVSGIKDNQINLSIKTFPNPTSDFLTLSFQDFPSGDVTYELLDASGKKIQTVRVEKAVSEIDFQAYPTGTYYLVLRVDSQRNSTYKIVKI